MFGIAPASESLARPHHGSAHEASRHAGSRWHDSTVQRDDTQPTDPTQLGRWQIVDRLGAGAMGVVFLGIDGNEASAVKVIRPDLASDTTFRARFRREVIAARRVSSRHVARVIEADPDDELPWMASELVRGPSLEELVRTEGVLEADALIGLAIALSEGLQAIHSAGIVHRDLKPSNVLMAPDGPRIVDFGIAQAAAMTAITTTGTVMGSPAFMAPEQALGQPISSACDIFALAGVIVFAARGRGPYGSGTTADVLYRVVHEEPQVPELPEPLAALVRAALAKDPTARPSADVLHSALTNAANSADATHISDATLTNLDLGSETLVSKTRRRPTGARAAGRRSERALIFASVVIVATAVLTYLWATHAQDSSTKPPGSAATAPPTTTRRPRATTGPTTRSTSSVPTSGNENSQLTLAQGPYPFLIPVGWKEQPLQNAGGPASSASFTDPTSPAAIDYTVSGGESGVIYNPDRSPNIAQALTMTGCGLTGDTAISPYKAAYSCGYPRPGFEINGVIIINPYADGPMGWEKLQVLLPTSLHADATQILNSFH